jgi:hypothetical protein
MELLIGLEVRRASLGRCTTGPVVQGPGDAWPSLPIIERKAVRGTPNELAAQRLAPLPCVIALRHCLAPVPCASALQQRHAPVSFPTLHRKPKQIVETIQPCVIKLTNALDTNHATTHATIHATTTDKST